MAPVPLLLMVFAFVCFALSAAPPAQPHWQRLVSAGLAFWALVLVLAYSGLVAR